MPASGAGTSSSATGRAERTSLNVETVATPFGAFLLVADENGTLLAADFEDCMTRPLHLFRRAVRSVEL